MSAEVTGDWAAAAAELVRAAGAVVRERFVRVAGTPERKAAADFVTETDRRSEAVLVEAIRGAFPEHGILAEESGLHPGASEVRWLVDPLDGTGNFLHRVPHFAILLAVQVRDGDRWQTQVGVTLDPLRDELFVAERGRGVTLDGEPVRVSSAARIEDGLFATGFPSDRAELPVEETNHREYCAVNQVSHGVRRFGSAGLDLAYVAAGRFEGFWEAGLGPWDVGGGGLMVTEAGGSFTTLEGRAVRFADPWSTPTVVATNGRVHQDLLRMVRDARQQPV